MESDIYWVDTRNADSRDHRTQGGSSSPWRPGTRPAQAVVAQPAQIYSAPAQPMYYQNPYGNPYMNPYGNPYMTPPQGTLASNLFGKITGGQLVDLVAQIFAALMPLPAAPVATDVVGTDVGNLILYQNALASYAKRDEQVRTLGNLVTKLLG
jgi:hypothetical protein